GAAVVASGTQGEAARARAIALQGVEARAAVDRDRLDVSVGDLRAAGNRPVEAFLEDAGGGPGPGDGAVVRLSVDGQGVDAGPAVEGQRGRDGAQGQGGAAHVEDVVTGPRVGRGRDGGGQDIERVGPRPGTDSQVLEAVVGQGPQGGGGPVSPVAGQHGGDL